MKWYQGWDPEVKVFVGLFVGAVTFVVICAIKGWFDWRYFVIGLSAGMLFSLLARR